MFKTRSWILMAMFDMIPVLTAEKALEQAMLLELFTKQPQSKKNASQLRGQKSRYIRHQRKLADSVKPKKKANIKVQPIDPAQLSEEEREKARAWAAEIGAEVQ